MAAAFQTDTFQNNAFEVGAGGAPEVRVLGNSLIITNGDATPSTSDHTDFGTVVQGAAAPSRTYTVSNIGDADLTTSGLSVPSGFSITEGLAATIAALGSDTFTVQLSTATVGVFSGNISFANNDSDENPHVFAITGTVIAPPPPPPPPPPGSGSGGAGQFIGKFYDPTIHGLLNARRRSNVR